MKNFQSTFSTFGFVRYVAMTSLFILLAGLGASAQNRLVPGKSGSANLVSTSIVINEVYGGGGNAGATYTNDFIELQNRGSAPVDLTGWSVQYASAAGTTWAVTNLNGVIVQPGRYHLVQEAVGGAGTVALPTPDSTGTIAMSSTAGKVALVNTTTALTGACPTGAQIIDFVGYGATASCFEGAAPTPAPSNTTSVNRVIGPDTDQNGTDFVAGGPNPFTVSAANAMLQGRVVTSAGFGIGNTRILITDGTVLARTAITNPFGYFTFDDLPTGRTYFISVQSKQYQFNNPTQAVTLDDDLTSLVFQAQP